MVEPRGSVLVGSAWRMTSMARELVITNPRDIPGGFIPMKSIARPDYDRVKKAVIRREIDAVCLYPNGERVWRPRKWVHKGQVDALIEMYRRREEKNVFKVSTQEEIVERVVENAKPQIDETAKQSVYLALTELTNSIDLLTMAVQDLTNATAKATAAQGERDLYALQSQNAG
jgi:hypothetical protein